MKIAVVGPFPPYRGGIAHFNERLAQALHDQGHEVFAVNFSFQYPDFLFPGKSQVENKSIEYPYRHERLINTINPISWYNAASVVNKFAPDLVIFRFWLPLIAPALGTVAGRLKATQRVAIMDNVIPHEKRPGDKRLTQYFVDRMDGFVTLAEALNEDLDQFDSQKPRLNLFHPIYNQFGDKVNKNEAREYLCVDPEDRLIVFFGFIREYKGLDLLLKAMADDNLSMLNVKLIVAGEFYEDPQPYYDLIEKHNLSQRVMLREEFIPSDEVKYYFCAADCVVQPYKAATQSGVTQIAFHFERPMIVTRVSGLPELVPHGECAYVVPPDAVSLAQAINQFYDHNKEKIFAQNVAERKKQYSWESFVGRLLDWAREFGLNL